ncbi:MAG: DUF3575 domain-containing protein [Muribaculaceae bacterium]|nr:DUF3575 domain-containing protein [Muribaculaceae bacterium]
MRCDAIADYVAEHTGVSRNFIETYPGGIAWEELRRMVEDNPAVPSREKVLEILTNVPVWVHNSKGAIIDGRKKRLMELDRGDTYKWMLTNLFPELRNAVAVTIFYRQEVMKPQAAEPEATRHTDIAESYVEDEKAEGSEAQENLDMGDRPTGSKGLGESDDMPGAEGHDRTDSMYDEAGIDKTDKTEADKITDEPERMQTAVSGIHKSFYMDVRTNMLYDAALVPNLGAEFYIGKNLSVYGEWMYAWWDNETSHRSWRIYGGDLGLRWWFGRKAHAKPLTGHHLGVYYGILTFDFATGDNGYLGGKPNGTLWDRWLINTGLEYGYSLPVGKRLNIDFSIGLGYMGGNYIKYFPFDNDYYRDKEYKMHFFGPTKAEISLVWLIGRGNDNSRKGGGR